MKLMIKITILVLMLPFCLSAQHTFSVDSLRKHVYILASDSLQGLGTGTPGEEKAASYIADHYKRIGLQPLGDSLTYFQWFPFKTGLHGDSGRKGMARNVVGMIDNQQTRTIIIGAHYDHLGDGSDGHSLDPTIKLAIHNGADDNASGVAGLIELARYFKENTIREQFNFVFVAFSGEELGLIGSSFFVDNQIVKKDSIAFMLNMDMIGRLRTDSAQVYINGYGTCREWEELIKATNSRNMKLVYDSSGLGPSDHASFYKKQIPALHFFSGAHTDYHKPSDDSDKVNFEGIASIITILSEICIHANHDQKFEFLETRNPAPAGSPRFKVTLGIMPSYQDNGDGLKVEAALDGKPAKAAGILSGDLIVELDNKPINGMKSYMSALGELEKGAKTSIVVIRDGKRIRLSIQL